MGFIEENPKEANPWDGGSIVVLEKPWKCSLQQFNSSRTTLCEKKNSTLLRVCHTRDGEWRINARLECLLLCCTVSPRSLWHVNHLG